ncbi:MAG: hypothetical protein V7750_10630 [Sneathiella sp.]
MATSRSNEQSNTNRNFDVVFGFAATVWKQYGDYLQRRHQVRKNNKTYQRLLENDDYLLRDIGISRKIIQQMKHSTHNEDAGFKLQKIRSTAGRYF